MRLKVKMRAALVCVVAAIAGALALYAAPAGATTRTWRSGVFAGYGPAADVQFGTWRGAAVQTATDYLGSDDWSEIEDPTWTIAQWGSAPGVRPDLTVALWPATGGSLAEAASGAYDSHFAALAENLVAGGLGDATIRLGWEFNAAWYRWSVRTPSDAANFAQAWRTIVTAMRAVPGAAFSFDWSPTQSAGGVDPALAYPGDAYVSDIGLDVYDWNQAPDETAAQRWSALVHHGYGLAWQAGFAAAHGKPIAFPEWGLVGFPWNPSLGGGDDPLFVANMFAWFAGHDTAFENYFDADAPSLGFYAGLTTGNGLFPMATAVYHELYAQASRPDRPPARKRIRRPRRRRGPNR
jgi:hypothetical protein